jgi:hypothetical protein
MLSLVFPVPAGQAASPIGPVQILRVIDNALQPDVSAPPVAVYHAGFWQVGQEHYTSFEVEGPARVHCEDKSGQCSAIIGPFPRLKFFDGALRLGDANILALYDEHLHEWRLFPEGKTYPVLVID